MSAQLVVIGKQQSMPNQTPAKWTEMQAQRIIACNLWKPWATQIEPTKPLRQAHAARDTFQLDSPSERAASILLGRIGEGPRGRKYR